MKRAIALWILLWLTSPALAASDTQTPKHTAANTCEDLLRKRMIDSALRLGDLVTSPVRTLPYIVATLNSLFTSGGGTFTSEEVGPVAVRVMSVHHFFRLAIEPTKGLSQEQPVQFRDPIWFDVHDFLYGSEVRDLSPKVIEVRFTKNVLSIEVQQTAFSFNPEGFKSRGAKGQRLEIELTPELQVQRITALSGPSWLPKSVWRKISVTTTAGQWPRY